MARQRVVHFHFGPKRSGVGVFIDTVFTDQALPWETVHLSGEDLLARGFAKRFFAGVFMLIRRPEKVVFAHTLKAGIAAALMKIVRPRRRLVYVGHGVRFHQKDRRRLANLRFLLAEWFVYRVADRVVQIRVIDCQQARAIAGSRDKAKIILIRPRLGSPL